MKIVFRRAFPLALVLGVISCSSSTVIDSHPQGAKVFVDGSYLGFTPYTYSDTKVVGSRTSLKLSLDGYRDFYTAIHRDQQLNVGALIGGFFLIVPWAWMMDYRSGYTFELTKATAADEVANQEYNPNSPSLVPLSLERKLLQLKKMYDDSLINRSEYDKLRQRAIDSAK
jgi:hypothetical protein